MFEEFDDGLVPNFTVEFDRRFLSQEIGYLGMKEKILEGHVGKVRRISVESVTVGI